MDFCVCSIFREGKFSPITRGFSHLKQEEHLRFALPVPYREQAIVDKRKRILCSKELENMIIQYTGRRIRRMRMESSFPEPDRVWTSGASAQRYVQLVQHECGNLHIGDSLAGDATRSWQVVWFFKPEKCVPPHVETGFVLFAVGGACSILSQANNSQV